MKTNLLLAAAAVAIVAGCERSGFEVKKKSGESSPDATAAAKTTEQKRFEFEKKKNDLYYVTYSKLKTLGVDVNDMHASNYHISKHVELSQVEDLEKAKVLLQKFIQDGTDVLRIADELHSPELNRALVKSNIENAEKLKDLCERQIINYQSVTTHI